MLFYRTGGLPTLAEFVEQARRMFVGFHTRLKTNELLRICQCGACSGAPGLTLKIVAHFGAASPMQVKGQQKFIGTGVIVAHRLLKNSAPGREYLLLTRELLDALGPGRDVGPPFTDGSDSFDEIGRIEYRHMSMQAYHDEVKVDPPEPFALKEPHQAMIDLPSRTLWIELTVSYAQALRGPWVLPMLRLSPGFDSSSSWPTFSCFDLAATRASRCSRPRCLPRAPRRSSTPNGATSNCPRATCVARP